MSTFRDENWETRETTLGDPAEKAFALWCDQHGWAYVKYGLDRPPVDLSQVEPEIRYTPDFLADQLGLVEVQGCGKDGLFKFKHDKLEALRTWDYHLATVQVWLWHQPSDQCVVVPIVDLARMCYSHGGYRTDGLFDGHKPFASVSWVALGGVA